MNSATVIAELKGEIVKAGGPGSGPHAGGGGQNDTSRLGMFGSGTSKAALHDEVAFKKSDAKDFERRNDYEVKKLGREKRLIGTMPDAKPHEIAMYHGLIDGGDSHGEAINTLRGERLMSQRVRSKLTSSAVLESIKAGAPVGNRNAAKDYVERSGIGDKSWDTSIRKHDEKAVGDAKRWIPGFKPLKVVGDIVHEPQLHGYIPAGDTGDSKTSVSKNLRVFGFKSLGEDSDGQSVSFRHPDGHEVSVDKYHSGGPVNGLGIRVYPHYSVDKTLSSDASDPDTIRAVWSEEAREAALEARRAHMKTAEAASTNADDESRKATDNAGHRHAADVHEQAAQENEQAGNDDKVAYHRSMVDYHKEAQKAHAFGKSEAAKPISETVQGHDAAAKEYTRLADENEKNGNFADARFHRDMAEHHTKVAKENGETSEAEAHADFAEKHAAAAKGSGEEAKQSSDVAALHAHAASAAAEKSGDEKDHEHAERAHKAAANASGIKSEKGKAHLLTSEAHGEKKYSGVGSSGGVATHKDRKRNEPDEATLASRFKGGIVNRIMEEKKTKASQFTGEEKLSVVKAAWSDAAREASAEAVSGETKISTILASKRVISGTDTLFTIKSSLTKQQSNK